MTTTPPIAAALDTTAATTAVAQARPKFLSEADCHDIGARLARYAAGGGMTAATIVSQWTGNVRWARNLVSTSGETRDDHILVSRNINGQYNVWTEIDDNSDTALVAALRRAERMTEFRAATSPRADILAHFDPEPYTAPTLFFDATYQMDAAQRAEAARTLAQSAADAGLLSAGYIQVSARSQALVTSYGYTRYFQYTWARYSVTVRDPKGTGSGWAGVDWPDWSKVDGETLSRMALDKCLKSRNPVAIEPGRYTTILEPQATGDFVGMLTTGEWWSPVSFPDIHYQALDRYGNQTYPAFPFFKGGDPQKRGIGYARIGERVVDERLTFSSDLFDPELGFPPFKSVQNLEKAIFPWTDVYHPVTWIKDGVLVHLGYDRDYAVQSLGQNLGQPVQGALRMTGGTTTVEEMIATTKRGVLVTRFDRVTAIAEGGGSLLCRGYTRDGLWLIEDGKISKAIRNMLFTESITTALNNVEQLGVPQRIFHPPANRWWAQPQPMIMPPIKIRDFAFTALTSAI